MKKPIQSGLRKLGLDVQRVTTARDPYPDFSPSLRDIVRQVQPFTMTSPERIAALVDAVQYVDRFGIAGSIVECGVWRGGSSMAAALAHLGSRPSPVRQMYLFDTFEGMPPPSDDDVDVFGRDAARLLATADRESDWMWGVADLASVRTNLGSTGYPTERLTYVVGRVEDTIPDQAPDVIAVLRIDTDWYESTKHELAHLASRIAPGGVLIVDDYGHWSGARRAVDEWIESNKRPVLLHRIDYTGRIAVLP